MHEPEHDDHPRVRALFAKARAPGSARRAPPQPRAAVDAALGQQTLALLRLLEAACVNADQLADAAAQAFQQHPDASILLSFPGIGPILGARLLGEIAR